MTDEFIANASRWKLALFSLGSLGFVLLGLWILGVFGEAPERARNSPIFGASFGILATVFFGFCFFAISRQFIGGGELLRINASGIVALRWSDQLIPWSEIEDVSTWSHRGTRVINLHLRNPEFYPGKGIAAVLQKANRSMVGGDIHIAMTGLDRSFSDALDAIEYHWQRS